MDPSHRSTGIVEPIVGAGAVLLAVALLQRLATSLQPGPNPTSNEGVLYASALAVAVVATGAGALVVGLLAWRSSSIAVATTYAIVGAALVAVLPIAYAFQVGPAWETADLVYGVSLPGVAVIGGAMLVAGLTVVVGQLRRRADPASGVHAGPVQGQA